MESSQPNDPIHLLKTAEVEWKISRGAQQTMENQQATNKAEKYRHFFFLFFFFLFSLKY